jgi:hypothetical protein
MCVRREPKNRKGNYFSMCLLDYNQIDRVYGSDLTERQKCHVIAFSLPFRIAGTARLADGSMDLIVNRFELSSATVKRILAEYDTKLIPGVLFPDLLPKSRENCGIDSGLTDEVLQNIFDLHEMTNGRLSVRAMSHHYYMEFGESIPPTKMLRYLMKMKGKYRSAYVKPLLSETQMIARLEFIISLVEHRGFGSFRFVCLKNWIHL